MDIINHFLGNNSEHCHILFYHHAQDREKIIPERDSKARYALDA